MKKTQQGSYKIKAMSDPGRELDRLKQQGEAFRELEIKTLKQCGLKPDDRVLELGCGPGFVTGILAELASQGELISVDNDPALLKQIDKSSLKPPVGGFKTIEASAEDVPVNSEWADFTYARFLLQHVASPQAVADEAFRCSKPGGIFCAVDSDDGLIIRYPSDKYLDDFLDKVQRKQAEYGGDRFIGRKLFSLMRNAGFTDIQVNLLSLNTTEVSPQILMGILLGYKNTLLNDSVADSTQFMHSLIERAEQGDLLLTAGVFIVVGKKPVE